ncbi:BlaI/MecI/CopY family transcriptional regulator [Ruminococcus sp. JL13D9]|uniref:BlaI/MecI/CopY family transcriptional regulator n=1 Tax=Ruminococcus sp. JL13D9 TaxID=3233381 RepID=UPI00389988C4
MKNLGLVEGKFCDLVWANAPVTTAQLIKLCEKELNWKRTTTYTVLKHMINRGLFENDNKTVRVLITRDEFYADQSREYVSEQFEGSLPKFIAAFTSKSKLSREEAEELKRMIDNASED